MARDAAIVEEMIRRSLAVKGQDRRGGPEGNGRARPAEPRPYLRPCPGERQRVSGWTHGEAVAWGMGRALAVGVRLGVTDPFAVHPVESLLRLYGFRLRAPPGFSELAPALERDKKRRGRQDQAGHSLRGSATSGCREGPPRTLPRFSQRRAERKKERRAHEDREEHV